MIHAIVSDYAYSSQNIYPIIIYHTIKQVSNKVDIVAISFLITHIESCIYFFIFLFTNYISKYILEVHQLESIYPSLCIDIKSSCIDIKSSCIDIKSSCIILPID